MTLSLKQQSTQNFHISDMSQPAFSDLLDTGSHAAGLLGQTPNA